MGNLVALRHLITITTSTAIESPSPSPTASSSSFSFSSASASSSSSFRHVFCCHFAARCGPNCIGMMVAMPDQHRGELRVFCPILVRHSHHHANPVETTSGCEKMRARTSLQGATFCPIYNSLACRRRYRPKVGPKSRVATIFYLGSTSAPSRPGEGLGEGLAS